MKVVTLLENTTCGDLRCEHGLSLYIETKKHKILFDSGASDAFFENAKALGVDLTAVDIAFLSHAHNDHCGGLAHFCELNKTAKVYMQKEAFGEYYVVTPARQAFIGLSDEVK
ncbi:MAG: MBL fold metallo-hydrolase, partial [Oscillospiraceae bacterium]|nr:MBL fold metallo-hydrolase [Oscillospiraceae bacterium]